MKALGVANVHYLDITTAGAGAWKNMTTEGCPGQLTTNGLTAPLFSFQWRKIYGFRLCCVRHPTTEGRVLDPMTCEQHTLYSNQE